MIIPFNHLNILKNKISDKNDTNGRLHKLMQRGIIIIPLIYTINLYSNRLIINADIHKTIYLFNVIIDSCDLSLISESFFSLFLIFVDHYDYLHCYYHKTILKTNNPFYLLLIVINNQYNY